MEKSELAKGDKTCQGGDEGSRAADVNAQKQGRVVGCEAGEENCRGNVAYCLAGEGGNQKCVLLQKGRNQGVDCIESRKISCENKEEEKGAKQGIVHHFQGVAVGEVKNHGNDKQARHKGNQAENNEDRHKEKQSVEGCFFEVKFFAEFFIEGEFYGFYGQTRYNKQRNSQEKRRQHNFAEFTCGDVEIGVEIKVLRIAEGGQHTA